MLLQFLLNNEFRLMRIFVGACLDCGSSVNKLACKMQFQSWIWDLVFLKGFLKGLLVKGSIRICRDLGWFTRGWNSSLATCMKWSQTPGSGCIGAGRAQRGGAVAVELRAEESCNMLPT